MDDVIDFLHGTADFISSAIGTGLLSGSMTYPTNCSLEPDFSCTNFWGFDSLLYSESEAGLISTVLAFVGGLALYGIAGWLEHLREEAG